MTPANALHELFRSKAYVQRDAPSGANAVTYTIDRQLKVIEIQQNTVSAAETRTVAGPTRSGVLCALVLYSTAASGTTQVALQNSAGSTTSTITFTNVGSLVLLYSATGGASGGSDTFKWTPIFSNV